MRAPTLLLLIPLLAAGGCLAGSEGGTADAAASVDTASTLDAADTHGGGTQGSDTAQSIDTAQVEDTAPAADTDTVGPGPDAGGGFVPPGPVDESVCTDCTAGISVTEGHTVGVLTRVHLIGPATTADGATIVDWQWVVDAPTGSVSLFAPSARAQRPTFELNVVGRYRFTLWVTEAGEGRIPKSAGAYDVDAVAGDALLVELTWHTPGDGDESDEGFNAFGESVGSDVDLHVNLSRFANGFDLDQNGVPDGWFDDRWDCFWSNPHPNWGAETLDDDPGLDRDDTDGAGPEVTRISPGDGTVETYEIGVHYWDDWGFGEALATVRIYVFDELVAEVTDVRLVNHDMWEVASVAWPSGEVTLHAAEDGTQRIRHDYWDLLFGL
ncbi:MAG: hypothetical protein KC635_11370 [Myxococcales bacterium]|nr:hypothetical protein [Myxococcales bacterium]